jgi:hypothetical protein
VPLIRAESLAVALYGALSGRPTYKDAAAGFLGVMSLRRVSYIYTLSIHMTNRKRRYNRNIFQKQVLAIETNLIKLKQHRSMMCRVFSTQRNPPFGSKEANE